MAHKKGMGSTRNGRDSEAKRLGVKKFGGEMEADEIGIPIESGMVLPCGISARWSKT